MRVDILLTFALAGAVAAKGSSPKKPPKSVAKPPPPPSSKADAPPPASSKVVAPPPSSKIVTPPSSSKAPPPPSSSAPAPSPSSAAKSSTVVVSSSVSSIKPSPSSASSSAAISSAASSLSSSRAASSSSTATSSASRSLSSSFVTSSSSAAVRPSFSPLTSSRAASSSFTSTPTGSVQTSSSSAVVGSVVGSVASLGATTSPFSSTPSASVTFSSSTVSVSSASVTISATSPSITVTSFSSTVSSSTSSSISSTASGVCFYKGYTPKIDPGPDDDTTSQKRSVGGRVLIEKRANRAPDAFGACDIKGKIGGKLALRDNPSVAQVLSDANDAGSIPKWFRVKEQCTAAPGLETIGDSDPDLKATITIAGFKRTRTLPKYNVDHVWELKLMSRFFESVLPKTAGATSTLTCDDFEKSFVITGKAQADQPIQQLYNNMPQALQSSGQTPNTLEFAGLSVEINGKKARILTPKTEPSSLYGTPFRGMLKSTKDKIEALRAVGTAVDFMNDGKITPLFNRAQARLKAYLQTVDTRIADKTAPIALSKAFVWADEFEKFIKDFIDERGDETYTWVHNMIAEVQKEIDVMPVATQANKDDKAAHQKWLDVFKSSGYSQKTHYTIHWTA